MILRLIICISALSTSHATRQWIIAKLPIILGEDITLTCETGQILKNSTTCLVRQWFSGPQYKQLLYNSFPSDKSKYEDRTDLSTTQFSLVIKNSTMSDLNINYTCSCGFQSFTKNLSISENNLVVQPENKSIIIQQNRGNMSIEINLQGVYPQPKCHLLIGCRRNETLDLQTTRNGIFYDCAFKNDFGLTSEDCMKTSKVTCEVGNKHIIVSEEGDLINSCSEVVKEKGKRRLLPGIQETNRIKETTMNEGVVKVAFIGGAVVVLVSALVVVFIYKRNRNDKAGTQSPVSEIQKSAERPPHMPWLSNLYDVRTSLLAENNISHEESV